MQLLLLLLLVTVVSSPLPHATFSDPSVVHHSSLSVETRSVPFALQFSFPFWTLLYQLHESTARSREINVGDSFPNATALKYAALT